MHCQAQLGTTAFNILVKRKQNKEKKKNRKEILRYSQHHIVSKFFCRKVGWVLLEVRLLGVGQIFRCVLRAQMNKPVDNKTQLISPSSFNGSP